MKQYILIIITSLLSITAFGQKHAGIEKSPNFRELGGIAVNENEKIKEGIIYRSGSFSELENSDAQTFKATGIKTIVDFRSSFEIDKEPDYLPEELDITWINAPIGNLNPAMLGKFTQVLMSPDFDEKAVEQLMIDINVGFIENASDFKPLFDELLETENPLLFHCSAGKDRTGLASSLLLHALGADWDTIMVDFMRSNDAVAKLDKSKPNAYGIPQDRLDMLMGVKPSYLESAWDKAVQKYGTMDNLLSQELGIGEDEKKILRSKYLEKISQ
ncbi:tyrosine-protein phosphatase [Belliella sp. DSM 111904]|uniref:Tyrosine-protein phosphatase n=1 Tax=Belliella filtrata TaxID=2923435 RepID=A0ABS9UUL7_9BACT|nr:tyrosine-protein phosphatase [Belliella filtrata]MCH7407855.1 tyrosine-protein phosphatase [Belliella filtrata]